MSDSALSVDDTGAVRVLVVTGEVDLNAAPALVVRMRELVGPARAVVLDLTQVTFFDSSGVRLVDELARACAPQRLPWRVVAPAGSPARRVLELVGMAGSQVVLDRAGALDALG